MLLPELFLSTFRRFWSHNLSSLSHHISIWLSLCVSVTNNPLLHSVCQPDTTNTTTHFSLFSVVTDVIWAFATKVVQK